MKRLYLLTSIAMGALLLFATMAWGQEASVIDGVEKVIIRAFITGTPPTASAYLEVRNSDGTFATTSTYDPTQIVVTELPSSLLVKGQDLSYPNAYRIHNADLTSSDISISQDETDGTIYVFCVDSNWHAMKFVVQNLMLIGTCGASNGGTFTSKPLTNLCSIGDPSTVTGTGPWDWTCTVAGQTTPTRCSANIQTWKITPSAGSGGSISPSTQQTLNSGSTTSFTVTPNSGYTATVGGTCGGSPTTGATPFAYTTNAIGADCTVSATFALTPVNGACGTTNNTCTSGTLEDIADSPTQYLWNCKGINGGADATPSCSLAKSTGTPDLDFTRSYGFIYGITTSGCTTNGGTCQVNMSIVNNGNGPAGNFNVKLWISGSPFVDANAQLLGTWNVAGLAAGQMLAGSITGSYHGLPVHNTYYLIIKIDADNQVAESNETNNTYGWLGPYVFQ